VQNAYHAAARAQHDNILRREAAEGDRTGEFWRLGVRLSFNLDRLRAPQQGPG
jgi:hypothetical protein